MKTRKFRVTLVSLGTLLILPAAAEILLPVMRAATTSIDSARIAAVTQQYPNFTAEQHLATLREIQSELHPLWKNLSFQARLAKAGALVARLIESRNATATPAAPSASFVGNLTALTAPSDQAIGLQRQSNCSVSLYNGNLKLGSQPTLQILATTPNFEQVLHSSAGLTTKADVFAKGCADPTLGIGARRAVYLGMTSQNQYLVAATGYDGLTGGNALFYGTVDPNTMAVTAFTADSSVPGVDPIAAGDLNGDGVADVVGINTTAASIAVWLTKANGTLSAPVSYALPGDSTEAAVLADVNGDGKVDVVVATLSTGGQETISVLTGNGDGTLNAPQSIAVATPASAHIANLIAADLRGTGHLDIVGSNGIVLLNSGTGTFTPGTSAFAPSMATSIFGPNLAAADFNNDGKVDIAVSNGATVDIYLGKGDGTFTAGKSYSSIGDVGYVTATDLDGDGNVDLYIGTANGGVFQGDQLEENQAYVLMGNGDGTFQGAPIVPFIYTGQNMADLTGNKILDAVGVNSDLSFTSFLGDGKGGFTAHSTLVTSPITIGGTQYSLQNIDSFALGDINGDGIEDIAYIAPTLNGIPNDSGGTGVFIALGNGQGGFGAPSFYALAAAPSSLTGAYTIYPTISNLHLADVNHDGKADLIYNYMYSYQNASNVNTTNAGTAVQLGNGDGTFQAPQLISFYSGPNLLAASSNGISSGIPYISAVTTIGDLNNDGNPDLIFITQTPTIDQTLSTYVASIQVALGKGDGTFSTPTTVAGPNIMTALSNSVVVADMNGDGKPDIVALGASTSYDAQVAVALGNGDGTFKAPVLTNYSAQYLNNQQGIAVADFNGDGKLDVALTDPYDSTGSGISLGNGDGTLQTVTAASDTVPSLAINLLVGGATLAADFNGDGKPDLLSGNVLLLGQAASTVPAMPSFSLTASSDMGSVTAGQAAQTTLTLTPTNGFTGSVSLACTGLPAGAACGFSPASVSINGAAATSTLSISTTTRTAMNLSTPADKPWLPGGMLLAGFGLPLAWRRRRDIAGMRYNGLPVLVVLLAVGLQSCGGGSGPAAVSGSNTGSSSGSTGTPAGAYTVTITATAGLITQSTTYALTVQ
jgi:hypothetical protein